MDQTHQDDYFCLNKVVLNTLIALEELLGKNGIQSVLSKANLSQLIDNYPTDDLEKNLSFTDFRSLFLALEVIYGLRGARSLAIKTGGYVFDAVYKNFGAISSMGDPAFTVLPLEIKLRVGIFAISKSISHISDQKVVFSEQADQLIYTVHNCPVCWQRSESEKPVCFFTVGLLQEALKWISGGLCFNIHELKCHAMGDDVCEFEIQKEPRNMLV
jgi:hypothetical protein